MEKYIKLITNISTIHNENYQEYYKLINSCAMNEKKIECKLKKISNNKIYTLLISENKENGFDKKVKIINNNIVDTYYYKIDENKERILSIKVMPDILNPIPRKTPPQPIQISQVEAKVKVEGPFTGGSDINIQNKLKNLYDKVGWYAKQDNNNYEFFYIQDDTKQNIIGAVRISNLLNGNNKLELDMDLVDTDHRRKRLYELLLKKRLKYIMDSKTNMYILYTEYDYLKNIHIKCGMTLSPNSKILVDDKYYWRFEYNRDYKTLVTKTTFPNNNNCSGIAIGNDGIKEFIYTAVHCLKTPNQEMELPITVSYPSYTDYHPIDFYKNKNNIKWGKQALNDNFSEDLDDVAFLNTNLLLDTSNIYILNNVHELPSDQQITLKCWGVTSGCVDRTLDDENELLNYMNKETFIKGKHEIDTNNYKKFIRKINKKMQSGDSGGPIGIEFGLNNKKFAIIGSVAMETPYIPSASRQIQWLKSHNFKFNKAHYDISTKEIIDINNND